MTSADENRFLSAVDPYCLRPCHTCDFIGQLSRDLIASVHVASATKHVTDMGVCCDSGGDIFASSLVLVSYVSDQKCKLSLRAQKKQKNRNRFAVCALGL